jgi:hypothetical protein
VSLGELLLSTYYGALHRIASSCPIDVFHTKRPAVEICSSVRGNEEDISIAYLFWSIFVYNSNEQINETILNNILFRLSSRFHSSVSKFL